MMYVIVRFSTEPAPPKSRETISSVYGIFHEKQKALDFGIEVIDKTDDEWFLYELTTHDFSVLPIEKAIIKSGLRQFNESLSDKYNG
jgi:DNA-dependent RNA polymerase auxiliary subunit epsilon